MAKCSDCGSLDKPIIEELWENNSCIFRCKECAKLAEVYQTKFKIG